MLKVVHIFKNYCDSTTSFWRWWLKRAPVSFFHSFIHSFFVCFGDIVGQFIIFTINYFIYNIFRCQTNTIFTIVPKIILVPLRCSLDIIGGCLLYSTICNRFFVDVWNSLKIRPSAVQGVLVCVKFLSEFIVTSFYIQFSLCALSESTMGKGLFIDPKIL